MSRPPKPPYIEVCCYNGLNGDRARFPVTMYLARIVGVNGKTKNLDSWGFSGAPGTTDLKYARDDANTYADLLGCSIVETDYRGREKGYLPPEPSARPLVSAPKRALYQTKLTDITKVGCEQREYGSYLPSDNPREDLLVRCPFCDAETRFNRRQPKLSYCDNGCGAFFHVDGTAHRMMEDPVHG